MKIVFGGAFNPVTNAHMEVYRYIMKHVEADEFIFLPVSSAYTKSELASNFHRVNMLKLATENFKDISISELEINDSDFLGTYQSLIRLSDRFNTELAFVVGADNLLSMHKWINIDGILSEFKIIVLSRNKLNIEQIIQDDVILQKHKDSFIIFKDFEMNLSSTLFRKTFNKELVPEEVFNYIKENDLY